MATYGQFYVYPLVDKLPIWSDRDQAEAIRIATRKEKLHVVRSEGALYCVRVLGVGYGYVRAEDVISEYEAAKQAQAARQQSRGAVYSSGPVPGRTHATFESAGFFERLVAYLIDWVISLCIAFSIGVLLRESGQVLVQLVGFVAGLTYWIGSWAGFGATPGKMVMGQQVVHAQTGERIGIGACFLRYIGMIISGVVLCLGYLWIIWDDEKQGWHDKIANTRVIKAR